MADYYAILTHIGEAKLANALALGEPLQITHLAVGDGEGQGAQGTPLPDPAQTTLRSERRRAPINTLSTDPTNPNVLIAEQVIPEDIGGWWIREMGLIDADGDLVGVCNTPPTYKPVLASGSGRTQVVRMALIVTDAAAVTLRVDPAVVLATRKYVDDQRQAHEESRAHPAATATEQGMVVLASDVVARAKASTKHALTPANLAALLATADFAGLVQLADAATAQGLTDATRALTSATLATVLGDAFFGAGGNYAKLPCILDGDLSYMLIQYGRVNVSGGEYITVTLPSPFADTNYRVVTTWNSSAFEGGSSFKGSFATRAETQTQFSLSAVDALGSNYSVYWIAVGRGVRA